MDEEEVYLTRSRAFPMLIERLYEKESIFAPYRDDPVAYAHDVLGVKPWAVQEEILSLCATKPNEDWHGKLAVGAGISTGKTFVGGVLINWFYDCRGPCLVPTTAPSQNSVNDLLWKEVRIQRGRAEPKWGIGPRDFIGPSAPEMRRAPDWWAKGYVAAKGENFKGRHVERMMFIFDEAVGLPVLYFRATKTMFKPDTDMLWLCFYNPTDTTSEMYQEIMQMDSTWRVIELSSLEHPNVTAELKGEPPPIPAAVSLGQVEEAIKDDCDPVDGVAQPQDFDWPPGSGRYFRPGGFFEGNFMGRWPSEDSTQLWSDALWKAVTVPLKWSDVVIPMDEIPQVGIDVARTGTNRTATSVSWGDYLVHFESKQGQDTMTTTGRAIELATEFTEKANEGRRAAKLPELRVQEIPFLIDDDGIGGAVTDRLRELGYYVVAIGAATKPARPNKYPDKRSELWFDLQKRGRAGRLKLGLIHQRELDKLKLQAKSPLQGVNSLGQRFVEPKESMMKRLDGKSPDGLDSINLSFYRSGSMVPEAIEVPHMPLHQRFTEQASDNDRRDEPRSMMGRRTPRRKLFGQRG